MLKSELFFCFFKSEKAQECVFVDISENFCYFCIKENIVWFVTPIEENCILQIFNFCHVNKVKIKGIKAEQDLAGEITRMYSCFDLFTTLFCLLAFGSLKLN